MSVRQSRIHVRFMPKPPARWFILSKFKCAVWKKAQKYGRFEFRTYTYSKGTLSWLHEHWFFKFLTLITSC